MKILHCPRLRLKNTSLCLFALEFPFQPRIYYGPFSTRGWKKDRTKGEASVPILLRHSTVMVMETNANLYLTANKLPNRSETDSDLRRKTITINLQIKI